MLRVIIRPNNFSQIASNFPLKTRNHSKTPTRTYTKMSLQCSKLLTVTNSPKPRKKDGLSKLNYTYTADI